MEMCCLHNNHGDQLSRDEKFTHTEMLYNRQMEVVLFGENDERTLVFLVCKHVNIKFIAFL